MRPPHLPNPRLRFLVSIGSVLLLSLSGPQGTAAPGRAHPPLSPGTYILHPGFELSLFAAEPDVVDPVALTFDEAGRAYVVEMRDYPYGVGQDRKPGGTIRLLEDTNGDGRVDRSILFAEALSFPTSIAPWNGGVIVTAPPEIIFLKDTTGDGRADVREVLFKGFNLGVTDSNVNGLRWGLDNRLHGVNGGNDGQIISSRRPGPAISIRGLDFSLDPATGDFATTYHTSGGFGLVFDEWGHSFVTYNINHLQQRIVPVRYLSRSPGLPPFDATTTISDHGEMARIYPISESETRPNHPEQSGHFSAAGGLGYAGVPGLAGDVSGSIWVCDVVGNVVHRDVLEDDGPIFRARRSTLEQTNEFFAATDRAMRPVGWELGPDDAFYLIDMQRDIIEHPDYIPARTLAGVNLRAGDDRGRIYRIAPTNSSRTKTRITRPGASSPAALVQHLTDPNQWWRLTAQRLLVERRDRSVIPALKELTRGTNTLGRLHALWTLQGLDALSEDLIVDALHTSHPGLRENALLLAESYLPQSQRLIGEVIATARDSSPRVRFQAALTLGQATGPAATAALSEIFKRDLEHRWTRLAVLSSVRNEEANLLVDLLEKETQMPAPARPFAIAAGRELADLCGARSGGSSNVLANVLKATAAAGARDTRWSEAVLSGLTEGIKRAPIAPPADGAVSNAVGQFLRDRSSRVLAAAWQLAAALGLPENETQRAALARARNRATDRTLPMGERLEDIRLLSFGSYAAVGDLLLELLTQPEPAEIQEATVVALRGFTDTRLPDSLVARWRGLTPSVRPQVLTLMLQRVAYHEALLGALESGRLTLGELNLDLEQRRRLLRRSSPAVMARAAKLFGDEEYGHRKTVVADWLARLPASGNPEKGRPIFQRLCTSCHVLDGTGYAVGPDLSAVAQRSVEDLISNILDPNMAINPAYVSYTAETIDGEFESGILQSETPAAIVLLQAQGRRVVVARQDIRSLRSTGVSLMPEGLEAGLKPEELRDLAAYLQLRR